MKQIMSVLRSPKLKADQLKGHHNVTVSEAKIVKYTPYNEEYEINGLEFKFNEFPGQSFIVANQFNKDFIANRYEADIIARGDYDVLIGKRFAVYPHEYPNGQKGIRFCPAVVEEDIDDDVPFRVVAEQPQGNTAREEKADEGLPSETSKEQRAKLNAILQDEEDQRVQKGLEAIIKENYNGYPSK